MSLLPILQNCSHYSSVLTCSVFCLTVKGSCRFPSWLVQDVEWIVDFGVRRRERTQTANAADDRHMLVNQWCHALALQVTAVPIITCWKRKVFSNDVQFGKNLFFLTFLLCRKLGVLPLMVHLKRSTTIVVTIIPHIETSGVIVHNSYYSSFKHIKIIVHKTLVPNFGIRDAHEARKIWVEEIKFTVDSQTI